VHKVQKEREREKTRFKVYPEKPKQGRGQMQNQKSGEFQLTGKPEKGRRSQSLPKQSHLITGKNCRITLTKGVTAGKV